MGPVLVCVLTAALLFSPLSSAQRPKIIELPVLPELPDPTLDGAVLGGAVVDGDGFLTLCKDGEPVLATGKVADCEKFYTPPPTELSIALTPSEPSDGPDFFEPGSSNASHTDEIIDSDNDELSEDEREALALGPHADLIPSAIAPEAELLEELVSKAASAPESKAFEPLSSSASPAERYWLKLKTGTISLQDLIAAAADDPFIFEGGSRYDYPAMDGRFGQTLDNP